MLTQYCTTFSLIIAVISCFSITWAEVSYSPIVKFIPTFKICLIRFILPIYSFIILSTPGYFLFSNLFLGSLASISNIVIS